MPAEIIFMYKKITLNISLLLILTCLLATFTQAQQTNTSSSPNTSPEKQALIKEYFEATGGRESTDKMLDAVFTNVENTVPTLVTARIEQDKNLTVTQKAEVLKGLTERTLNLTRKIRDGLRQELDFNKLVEDITYPLLDKYFTENELKELITFYKSPVGQKTISVQPQLYIDAVNKMNAALIPAMQKVMTRVTEEETAEMVKKVKRYKQPKR